MGKVNSDCFNRCPNCGAGEKDIDWGEKDWGDDTAWQNATCKKCGCEFEEIYQYVGTEYEPSELPKPVEKDYYYMYKTEDGVQDIAGPFDDEEHRNQDMGVDRNENQEYPDSYYPFETNKGAKVEI